MHQRPISILLPGILLSLTGCQSGDVSTREDYGEASFAASVNHHRISQRAEELRQANPDASEAEIYQIAQRRYATANQPSKHDRKRKAAQKAFEKDLVEVLAED